MSISYRPLLVPGIALAAAGVVALGPALVAPPAVTVAQPVAIPSVYLEEIQLAGIGQDIYYAITPWVQYAVELVQYGASLVPFIGFPIADQIDIFYFQTFQPAIEDTVNYLASLVQNPFNFIGATGLYGSQLYALGYNFVAAELAFFGFPVLPPLPPLVAASAPAAGLAAAAQHSSALDVAEAVQWAAVTPEVVEVTPKVMTGPEPIAEPEAVEVAAATEIGEVAAATEVAEVSVPTRVGRAARSAGARDAATAVPATPTEVAADAAETEPAAVNPVRRAVKAVGAEARESVKSVRAARSAE